MRMQEQLQATKRELSDLRHAHTMTLEDYQRRQTLSEADQQRVIDGFEREVELLRKELKQKKEQSNEMKQSQTEQMRTQQQLQQQLQETQNRLSQQLASQTAMAMR